MGTLAEMQSCAELDPVLAKEAASSAAGMRALLGRFAELARPGEGAPKILLALARLAEQPWVEGRLRVEISGDDDATTIEILSELGVGIVERMLPLTRLRVSFDEFLRAIDLAPELTLPLRATDADQRIILTPLLTPEAVAAPPNARSFELDDQSLGDGERVTARPPVPAEEIAAESVRIPDDEGLPLISEPPPTPVVEARPTPVVPVDAVAMAAARPRLDPRREPDDNDEPDESDD